MKEFIITEEELQKLADYIGKGTFYEVEHLIFIIRTIAGRVKEAEEVKS